MSFTKKGPGRTHKQCADWYSRTPEQQKYRGNKIMRTAVKGITGIKNGLR